MAAIVFDVREAERRLLAAGASPEVAEATADLMSNAVIHNLDSLVTREYMDHALDARFSQQDAKWERRFGEVEAAWEQRFNQLEAAWERRFNEVEAAWERRFNEAEAAWEQRFHGLESMFLELKGQFRVMQMVQALLLAGVFLPQLRALFS